MDLEPDFTCIGYVDQQACGDTVVEDIDSWLSINVAEMDEEITNNATSQTMDSSFGKRHLEPLQIPNESICSDKRGRTYIYDSSPTNHNTFPAPTHSTINTVSPPANMAVRATASTQRMNPTISAGDSACEDGDEDELKISFMNFRAGSIALFVPVDASKTSWMAFHSSRPNRFLAEESVRLFTHRQGRPVEKTRILAKIVFIEERVVPYNAQVAAGVTDSLAAGPGVKCGPGRYPAQGLGLGLPLAQAQALRGSAEGNPHRLAPGTVYYECFAEPVTVVKRG